MLRQAHRERPRRWWAAAVGAVLFVLFPLFVAFVAVGWWQGWFAVSTGSTEGQWHVGVTVDHEEMKSDINRVARERDEFTVDLKKQKEAEGMLVGTDPVQQEVTIAADGENVLTFRLDASSKLQRGEKAVPMADLIPGQRVRVQYTENEKGNLIRELKVVDGSSL